MRACVRACVGVCELLPKQYDDCNVLLYQVDYAVESFAALEHARESHGCVNLQARFQRRNPMRNGSACEMK
jgi:hypothetical protein